MISCTLTEMLSLVCLAWTASMVSATENALSIGKVAIQHHHRERGRESLLLWQWKLAMAKYQWDEMITYWIAYRALVQGSLVQFSLIRFPVRAKIEQSFWGDLTGSGHPEYMDRHSVRSTRQMKCHYMVANNISIVYPSSRAWEFVFIDVNLTLQLLHLMIEMNPGVS